MGVSRDGYLKGIKGISRCSISPPATNEEPISIELSNGIYKSYNYCLDFVFMIIDSLVQ